MPSIHLRARMNLLFASGSAPFEVNLTFKAGSLTGLYGSSGSGKTTLLRILAGLTKPETGRIQVGEQIWLDSERRINVPTQQRHVGMVFQDAALFPNMSVRQNVQFATDNRRDSVVDELLELVGLTKLADRKPATLSGGQRQRVALVRALARRPQVLLLDEPFSALDAETREQLLAELERLHRRFGTTTILVSHQREEMQRVADQLIELNQGKATWVGTDSGLAAAPLQTVSGRIITISPAAAQVQIQLLNTSLVLKMPPNASKWQIGDVVTVTVDPATLVRPGD